MNTKGYKHSLRIRNACCFRTATRVNLKGLSVTLYVCCITFWLTNWREKLVHLNSCIKQKEKAVHHAPPTYDIIKNFCYMTCSISLWCRHFMVMISKFVVLLLLTQSLKFESVLLNS